MFKNSLFPPNAPNVTWRFKAYGNLRFSSYALIPKVSDIKLNSLRYKIQFLKLCVASLQSSFSRSKLVLYTLLKKDNEGLFFILDVFFWE